MGKKLDSLLLRRSSKSSKLESLANIAISRLEILKKQRHVHLSHARSDVIQLLNHGDQPSALLRVEWVIKEQNAVDSFVMIEKYCKLLIESVQLIESIRECPDKLKETISSLVFAASRCGEFPELHKIRENLASQFGKEFEACAVELRFNCRVNSKMIQKFSTRQFSLKTRQRMLTQIASERCIPFHLEGEISDISKESGDLKEKENRLELNEANLDNFEDGIVAQDLVEEIADEEFNDVAAAEQQVFDGYESSDQESNHQALVESNGSLEHKRHFYDDESSKDIKYSKKEFGLSKTDSIERFSSESEGKEMTENNNRTGEEFESNSNDETVRKPLNNRWSKRSETSSDKNSELSLYEFSKVGRYKYTFR